MLDPDTNSTVTDAALGREHEAGRYTADYLEKRSAEALDHWLGQAALYCAGAGNTPLALPKLVFDLRGMNAGEFVAGRRRYGGPCIRINRDLLQRYPQHMIQQVLPHEVAHYVVWVLHRRRTEPHGREWRAVMDFFGKPASVSHRMEVQPARRVRKHAFRCGCPTNPQYSSVLLKRHLRGARYQCRRCGERLLPTEEALAAIHSGRRA
jgi:SprT protein